MQERFRNRLKRLAAIPAILAGVAILALVVSSREPPRRAPVGEQARKARVIAVPSLTVVPRAIGHGNVRPGRVWEAVAQVAGKISEIHPQLKKGALLPKDAVLLRIDDADYRLALAQIEASIRGARARLAEIGIREANTRKSLDIEQRTVVLSRRALERKRRLLARGSAAEAAIDEAERALLGRRQSLQAMTSALDLVPAERDVQRAQLALYRARRAEAMLDLERTAIVMPFDGRIAAVNIEATQFVRQGQVLAVVDGIAAAEVDAQIAVAKLLPLVDPKFDPRRHGLPIMDQLPGLLGFTAVVRLGIGTLVSEWPARFARVSDTVDPRTRTLGVIVIVDDPYRSAIPGVRPPLTKNMYVEVEIRGRPRTAQRVIPGEALHDGRVYVVGEGNRLMVRKVTTGFAQSDFVTVADGLAKGERVIVSDLIPAIEGMLIDPVADEALAAALRRAAAGPAPDGAGR